MCLVCFEQGGFKNGLFVGPGNIFNKESGPDFTNEELEVFLINNPDRKINISYFNPTPTQDDNYDHKRFNLSISKIDELSSKFDNLSVVRGSLIDFLENYSNENFDYIFAKRVFHRIEKSEISTIIDLINKKSTSDRILEICVRHSNKLTKELLKNNTYIMNVFINKIKGIVKIIFYNNDND
jgi:hypothetical protein